MTAESNYAMVWFYVFLKTNYFDYLKVDVGETSEEKTMKIPVDDVENTFTYRIIDKTRNTNPKLVIRVLGWIE